MIVKNKEDVMRKQIIMSSGNNMMIDSWKHQEDIVDKCFILF